MTDAPAWMFHMLLAIGEVDILDRYFRRLDRQHVLAMVVAMEQVTREFLERHAVLVCPMFRIGAETNPGR